MRDAFPAITTERQRQVYHTVAMRKKSSEDDIHNSSSDKLKPRVVIFYKNGDRNFHGVQVSITPRRFRNFESLLNELTRIINLPHGVRYLFTPTGERLVEDLQELENGKSYVCASFRKFRRIDYGRASHLNISQAKIAVEKAKMVSPFNREEKERTNEVETAKVVRITAMKPRIITVVRNGYSKPRKAVKVLLNRKTAQSYEQVLNDITSAVGVVGSSGIRKLYTSEGVLVHDLSHLLNNGQVFVAVGNEKFNPSEIKAILEEENHIQQNSSKNVKGREKYEARAGREEVKNNRSHVPRRSEPEKLETFPRDILENKDLLEQNNNLKSVKDGDNIGLRKDKCTETTSSHSTNPVLPPIYTAATIPRKTSDGSRQTSFELLPDINESKQNSDKENHERSNTTISQSRKRVRPPGGTVEDYYIIGRTLGDGNFAVVREVTEKGTSKTYALKIIDASKTKGKEEMVRNEINIMKACKHKNIVHLVEDFHTSTEIHLIMELVDGGDLFDLISNSVKFPEKEAGEYLVDICKALNYLHVRNIVHRDLKPENLLVHVHADGMKSLKLADFGLAMKVTEPIFTVCGTPTYVAPEILNESGYGLEVDMWAAGVIGYIMLCGFPPFRSAQRRQSELFDLIESGEFQFLSPYWDDISDAAKNLISCLLVVNRKERYTAQKVLKHAWIKNCGSERSLSDLLHSDLRQSRKRFKAAALTVQSTQRLRLLASSFQLTRGEKVLTHVGPKA